MRARLLDMGEVSAVRSQSLARAAAAVLDPASDPVVVLVKPSEPIVSIGGSAPAPESVALDFCRAERIPVVRSPRREGAWFHGPGHLLLELVTPPGRASELGLGAESGRWPDRAARPLVAVCAQLGLDARVGERGRIEVAGRCIARFEASHLPSSVAVSWDLFVGSEPGELEAEARALAGSDGISTRELRESLAARRTSFAAELAEPLGFAQIAEAAVAALEAGLDLELVPSMPTPPEMDAIYEWDQRMLVSELLDGRRPGGVTHYVM